MTINWDGIYAAYMTGSEGQGFAMFVFKDGAIAGTDAVGVTFDGDYTCNNDGDLLGEVRVNIPPNGTVIQGLSTGAEGFKYVVPLSLNLADVDKPYITMDTPLGAVNLKLEKLRAL